MLLRNSLSIFDGIRLVTLHLQSYAFVLQSTALKNSTDISEVHAPRLSTQALRLSMLTFSCCSNLSLFEF